MEEKRALRREMKRRRDALDPAAHQAASAKIIEKILRFPSYEQAEGLALFIPFGSEVAIRPLFHAAWDGGKRLHVPRVEGGQLTFYQLESWEQCEPGAFNILEPVPERASRTDLAQLELILLPGLAFDRQGGRLGYGKGYYDRFLPQVHEEVPRVAIAFHCQVIGEVPQDLNDCTYDWLITEQVIQRGPIRHA